MLSAGQIRAIGDAIAIAVAGALGTRNGGGRHGGGGIEKNHVTRCFRVRASFLLLLPRSGSWT